jgi:two-component system, cell cycle response regulator
MQENNIPELLIVDDIPKNLQVLAGHLSDEPYELTMATSGEAALKAVKHNKPDLILLDVSMPGLNGYEVCKILKEDDKYSTIPILFLTAHNEVEDKLKGFEAGAVDYITKPFNQAELKARIKTHLELHYLKEELIKKNSELTKASITDPLTGISNRRGMIEQMGLELNRIERGSNPGGLLLSDIDNFKLINDNFGHDYGDYVLKEVTQIMRENIRSQDMLARWGWEEFLLFFVDSDIDGAYKAGDKIREAIESHNFTFNNITHKVTMTFGITLISEKGSLDFYVKQADLALYEGKDSGKNRVVIWS